MITCAQAVEQLWDYLEQEVSGEDRARINEHLAFCRRCCGEVEFARELRSLLASATEIDLPAAVELRLTGMLESLEHGAERPATEGEERTS